MQHVSSKKYLKNILFSKNKYKTICGQAIVESNIVYPIEYKESILIIYFYWPVNHSLLYL